MGIDPLTMAIGASVVGGVTQAGAAGKAADAQKDASDAQVDLAREQFDTVRTDLAPFRESGLLGNAALMYNLGLGEAPMIGGTAPEITTKQIQVGGGTVAPSLPLTLRPVRPTMSEDGQAPSYTTQYMVNGNAFSTLEEAQAYANANRTGGTIYGGYEETPGTKYLMQTGANSVNALAGARGGLQSGATLEALQKNAMGIAAQGYDNYLNRLTGLSDTGMNAAGMNAQNSANYVNAASNALSNYGNAAAAGAIGVGNAINSGIGNAISSYGYLSNLNRAGV